MAFVGLGVSGGIGAYKAVEVTRLLQQRGHRVQAILTRNARRFVGPLTFEAITRERVVTSQFAPGANARRRQASAGDEDATASGRSRSDIEHIDLASTMDVLLVAPATANVIGKFAHGIADDFLSALYLATKAPVLMAPAMNTHMWEHPAVVDNVNRLAARGVRFVDPGAGYLACGWIGTGRLAEPEAIAEAVDRLLTAGRSLAGRRVLVTAGPTIEDLDPVRFLGNRSSGRMGFAIAAEAAARGAEVSLVTGPVAIALPAVAELVRVRSAREMHEAVLARADAADIVVMAAAVADYAPAGGAAARKIEKGGALTLTLERTPDILAALGARRAGGTRPVLVGFAAQTGDPVPAARRKLDDKRVDLIVANDVTAPEAGFDVDTNQVTFVAADAAEPLPLLPKREVARLLLDRVERLLLAAPVAAGAPESRR